MIAMSRHAPRQKLAREFGATDIVSERGHHAVERIKELTNGIRADCVLECVGTQESMMQAIGSTRPGRHIGYVGVPHGVELDGEKPVEGCVNGAINGAYGSKYRNSSYLESMIGCRACAATVKAMPRATNETRKGS
jgi:threonine dehydrogenase-like Zn-dependent dehydrogenase